ncbi:phosphopantetheine-binding protein [Streptomyces sp. NPDC008121]|uniref:acyl carrier protein n=1 Tax=Streptomyces sp. NPDC008121 TaxID=3364809 RepID=UPI0036E0AD38
MISKDEIREILSWSRSLALSDDIGDDAEFVMDSFTMVTLQAALEDRHGIRLDPRFEELQTLNSVNDIHAYLLDRFPGTVAG